MKLCKDCKHYQIARKVGIFPDASTTIYQCLLSKVVFEDLINGEDIIKISECKDMRNGKCGTEGKLWEAK